MLCLGVSLFGAGQAAAQSGCGSIYPLTVTADPVAFGTYLSTSGTPTNANGRVTVACSQQTFGIYLPAFTVMLSAGLAASFAPRKMGNGSYRLNYNLYTSSAYTSVWGDGLSGTSTVIYSAISNAWSTSFTVYGRIPASQSAAAGNFSDTITVTVTY